ncbi:hypothetical protein D3C87_109600 [compost metagenome]
MIVLVATAATSIMFFSIMNGINQQVKSQLRSQSHFPVEFMQTKIRSSLENQFSWGSTIDSDNQFSCLKNNLNSCPVPATGSLFSLRSSSNELVTETNPEVGFDIYGDRCTGYSETTPNDNCPFRYEVRWSCNPSPCEPTVLLEGKRFADKPRVRVIATLKVSSNLYGGRMNTLRFDFSHNIGWEEQNLSSVCNSLAGYFNQESDTCKMIRPGSGAKCDQPSGYVIGFEQNGEVRCGTFNVVNKFCPNNSAVVGIAGDGGLRCNKF